MLDVLEIEADKQEFVDSWKSKTGTKIKTRQHYGDKQKQCPDCGGWFEILGRHWGLSTCDYSPISNKKYNMIAGLMIGDGSITRSQNTNSMSVTNTNLSFLHYLHDVFGWLSSTVCEERTAKQAAEMFNMSDGVGHTYDLSAKQCSDIYSLKLKSHPVFDHFACLDKKDLFQFNKFPFTPHLLRMWYVSDGNINKSDMTIHFTSHTDSNGVSSVINNFSKIGLDVNYYSGGDDFAIHADRDKFFDYIGHDPVPGFGYKWADTREEYERLKEQCDREHKTQTLEDND